MAVEDMANEHGHGHGHGHEKEEASTRLLWICKPDDGCRPEGIYGTTQPACQKARTKTKTKERGVMECPWAPGASDAPVLPASSTTLVTAEERSRLKLAACHVVPVMRRT